jgi:uncharacterized protein involved in exopolysaccharide biosynthesis
MSVQKKLAPSAYPSTSPGDVISGLFAAAPAADAIDLRELGRRLWRRKGTIFGTAVTLSVLALLVIWQITPRYAADTYIMIEPRQQQVVDFTAVLSGLPADFETIESELEVIRSRGLMARVQCRPQAAQRASEPVRYPQVCAGGMDHGDLRL